MQCLRCFYLCVQNMVGRYGSDSKIGMHHIKIWQRLDMYDQPYLVRLMFGVTAHNFFTITDKFTC